MNVRFGISQANKKGFSRITCFVGSGKNEASFSTGIKILRSEWSFARGCAERDELTNTKLNIILNRVYTILINIDKTKTITPTEIVQRYKVQCEAPRIGLEEVWQEHEKVMLPGQSYNSYMRRRKAVKLFTEFSNSKVITGLTANTPKEFEVFMLHHKKYSFSHTRKIIQILKAIFTYAKNKYYIDVNPFDFYRPTKQPKVKQTYLTNDDIQKIQQVDLPENYDRVRDAFLFQCYTGLAYVDIKAFTNENITERSGVFFLFGNRHKTEETFFAPISNVALSLARKHNYQFKMLSNQKMNQYLKVIAKKAGVEKRITTHIGRRTFAQFAIDSGFSPESVAKMLGHANFKMTEKHYAKIGETRVTNEVLALLKNETFALAS